MVIKTLRLRNFRNYARQTIDFSNKLNIFYGENAQGKTNILEAVFLCSTGRSHRTQKDGEMIKFGEDAAVVGLDFYRENYGPSTIEIEIQRSGRKGVIVNGVPQRRSGDLLGRFNCVIFSPEDLSVIKEEPQNRRRFLDMFISQIKPAYYFNLHSYLSALRQRNALLRQSRENPRLLDSIGAWDSQLVEYGSRVIWERLYYIKLIGERAKAGHSQITGGREDLDVYYAPSLKETAFGSLRDVSDLFSRALDQGLQTDLLRMSTQSGPHKDDIACGIDGRSLRLYGSQGQQRTAALSMKMAQVGVMAAETGEMPVLLLDDVMSELDGARRENLSLNIEGAQVFLTGTEKYGAHTDTAAENGLYHIIGGAVSD